VLPRVVVVAVDAARLGLYAATLRMAGVPARSTLNVDEATEILTEHQPSVLVLDHGLPRLVIFRLYGKVRAAAADPRVKVLFVGQEGKTVPDDHYLPGEPSPLTVAALVRDLVAEADVAAAQRTPDAPTDDLPAWLAEPDRSDAPAETSAPTASLPTTTPTSTSVDEVATDDVIRDAREPEPAAVGVAAATVVAEPPTRPRRRLDVLIFRIGMVLLIIGGVLAYVRPESFTLPMLAPPTVVPAAPTPAPAVSPSPSPAARFDDAVLRFGVAAWSHAADHQSDLIRAPQVAALPHVCGTRTT